MVRLRWIRLWEWVAAVVLVLSAVVHIWTFFGEPGALMPGVMLLHLAIFPPFIAAIVISNKVEGPGAKKDLNELLTRLPKWVTTCVGVLFAYALLNFGLFMWMARGGSPAVQDGKYVMQSHGRVTREIDAAEYQRQNALVERGFSGHWMLFSAAAWMILAAAEAELRSKSATHALEHVDREPWAKDSA